MAYNAAGAEDPLRPLLSRQDPEVLERESKSTRRETLRFTSLVWSIGSALCAGSIATFSLYAPSLASHLHYSQLQINSLAISAALSAYLPVSAFGYICDTYSPRPVSLLSALLFSSGYALATLIYSAGPSQAYGGNGYPFWCMLLAFILIGAGTCTMYLGAIATVTKNYGRSNRRGIMMALPISAFGLSGMWESQIGMYFLYERGENGLSQGNVDPVKYFIFLAVLLTMVGLGGTVMLNVVGEDELIDEAIEEIERTELLSQELHGEEREEQQIYGAIYTDDDDMDTLDDEQQKKSWLLDYETRMFFCDKTMWLLCACFLLVSGPGEAYVNNIGTILQTTSSPASSSSIPPAGPASTHVSAFAVTSTFARLVTGYLSDTFGPSATKPSADQSSRKVVLSRPLLLIFTTCFSFLAFVLLSMPSLINTRPESALLLTTAMVGLGYGAVFTLTPIIVAIVWRVENFGTNWGVVMISPAVGATLSSGHFSYIFDGAGGADGRCFGWGCYGSWALGGTLSFAMAIILFAVTWFIWKEEKVIV